MPDGGWSMYITVNCNIIGSGNVLSPIRWQAITWTNAAQLLIGPSGTNLKSNSNQNEIIFVQENEYKNIRKMTVILLQLQYVNSPWSHDAIWQHRSGSTMGQEMAWCQTAPSHYLNQCWPPISEVLSQLPESTQEIFCMIIKKYTATCPRRQWVNSLRPSDAYVRQ